MNINISNLILTFRRYDEGVHWLDEFLKYWKFIRIIYDFFLSTQHSLDLHENIKILRSSSTSIFCGAKNLSMTFRNPQRDSIMRKSRKRTLWSVYIGHETHWLLLESWKSQRKEGEEGLDGLDNGKNRKEIIAWRNHRGRRRIQNYEKIFLMLDWEKRKKKQT